MLRWHGVMSICLLLAVAAGEGAIGGEPSWGTSRILRSVPLEKLDAAAEQLSQRSTTTRIPRAQPKRTQTDAPTTEPGRNGTVQQPAPVRTELSRQDFAAVLAALGVQSPFDLSGSGKYLVATEQSGVGLVLCDVASRRRLRNLQNSNRHYALVEISSDARWIAGVERDDNDSIDLWRADNGRRVGVLKAAGGEKQKLEFSAKGDQLSVQNRKGDGVVFSIPAGRQIGGSVGRGGTARQFRIELPPSDGIAPGIGGAPSRSPTPDPPEPQNAPPATRRFAVPKNAGPDASDAAAAPPAAAAPTLPRAPANDVPDATIRSAPKIVSPETTRSAPKMAVPRMAPPVQPRALGPAELVPALPPAPVITGPAAPRSMRIEEPFGEEPSGGSGPPTFGDVGSALPEAAADSIPETAAEPAATAPPDLAAEEAEETGAERAEESSAATRMTTAGDAASAPPPSKPDESRVTVNFATNRNRLVPKDRAWLVYFLGFFSSTPAFVIYGLVALAVLILPWFGKRSWAAMAVGVGVILLCGMGTLEAYVRSQLRSELSGELYGSRITDVSYGTCEVSVPPPENRQAGEVNRPFSVWVFESPENPEKHFVLRRVDEHSNKEAFLNSLDGQLDKTEARSALLFIHGYNVSFEDAIFRTAQLTVDLKFPGVPITFCWPSCADPVKYTFDEQQAEVSIPALRELLEDLAVKSGAERIHIIAHSMGNRVLAGAMEGMSPASRERNKQVIREVVLAAPDIDSRVFKAQVLPHIVDNTQHCTLYASSRDRALLISRYFHNYQRLGETEPDLIVATGMDTIDASLVDTSLLGHSYIGDVQSIVSDLHDLVVGGKQAAQRGLDSLQRGDFTYWTIRPQIQTQTASDPSPRR